MVVQARLNIDNTSFVIYAYPASRQDDGVIKQDGGRSTVLAQFTLMGKSEVVATSITADGGNTGDGTFTAIALAQGGIPLAGAWNLECVQAFTEGGIFKLEDPNGVEVASALTMTAGSGVATKFTVAGMTFTITDGAAGFIVGDKAEIVITADGDYVPLDVSGVGGAERVRGIYMSDDIAAADIVAGDIADNPILTHGARFNSDKLVFDDGTSTLDTILPSGETVREELAKLTLIPQTTQTASAAENA